MKKLISLFAITVSCVSCYDVGEVPSGEVKAIPNTKMYIVGSDSSFTIISMEDGSTVNVISRKK